MKAVIALSMLTLVGCATGPMTPEQQAFIKQWAHDRARAADQAAQTPYYKIVTPQQEQTTSNQTAPVLGPMTVQAVWTGRSAPAQSVTGSFGTNCEFNYAGKVFWRMFSGTCPSSISVQ